MGVIIAIISSAASAILGSIGFSSIGPVAGSCAATFQSVVYGGAVKAGSGFSALQSLAITL
jgi:hypothetical protein